MTQKKEQKQKSSHNTKVFHELQRAVRDAAFGERDRIAYRLHVDYGMDVLELAELCEITRSAMYGILNRERKKHSKLKKKKKNENIE